GLERANLVAIYRVTGPRRPELVQAVPAGVGPEGLLPLPQRDALVVAAEADSAGDNVRSPVSTYRITRTPLLVALERNAAAPSIVSAGNPPIGSGALSGLDAAPGIPGLLGGLVAVEDNAYTPTRVLSIDSLRRPARLTGALTVTRGGAPVGYDAEGIATRPGGGYWIAAEGNGRAIPNLLVEVDARGAVVREVPLPADIARAATSNGFEGVTTIGRGASERVWVAVQRTWADDAPGTVKLARFTPATGAWDFVAYPLDPAPAGATAGLSEVTTADDDTLLLIERDNRRGDDARIKKATRVELAGVTPVPAGAPRPVLAKQTVLNLIPALRRRRRQARGAGDHRARRASGCGGQRRARRRARRVGAATAGAGTPPLSWLSTQPSRVVGVPRVRVGLLFAALHFYWALGGDAGLASVAGTELAAERPQWFVLAGLWGVGLLLVAGTGLAVP
ncbi:MAG: esterase-like activity of phytase family protein, partial [Pseudonocardiaceae bacterium]